MPRTLVSLLCAAVGACAPFEMQVEPEPGELYAETAWTGSITGVGSTAPHRVLVSDLSGLWATDPLWSAPRRLARGTAALVDSARVGNTTFIATEEEIWVWRGSTLARSPLGDELTLPVEIDGSGDVLWVRSGDGLAAIVDDRWLDVPGAEDAETAVGGFIGTDRALWMASDQHLRAITREEDGWLERVRLAGAASHPVVDGSGCAWAIRSDRVVRYCRGDWTRFDLGSHAPVWLQAAPAAPGVWVATEAALLHAVGDEFRLVAQSVPAETRGVDDFGRLLVKSDDGVERWAAGRSVALAGLVLDQALEGPTRIAVVPHEAHLVEAAGVSVDGVPLDLDADGTGVLDPGALGVGEHLLEPWARWTDGTEGSGTYTLQVVAPRGVNWSEHIEPIYLEHCSRCHNGATQTLLDSPQRWEVRIDDILDAVESGRMPLGSAPLSSGEIALLSAWKDQGFALYGEGR